MFDRLKPHIEVKLHTNNEWNGLYGVVDNIKNDIAYIFCTKHPDYAYRIIKGYNENEIEIIK